ncbi:MAG: hypothetical protein WCT77_02935 [Bacteroidota bacterium]
MGTRNLTIVKMDGKYRIAQYGQWDGGPKHQGTTALEFLQTADLEKFKRQLNKTIFMGDNSPNIKKINKIFDTVEIACRKTKYKHTIGADNFDLMVAKKTLSKEDLFLYQCSTRDTGAKILEVIYKAPSKLKEIPLSNSIEFANESLFCEWAYVVDFDTNTFEVYNGFNKKPLTKKDRFYSRQQSTSKYFGIKLLKSYKLDKLPTLKTFLKLEPKD